jgi:hypothetical protein
VSINQIEEFVHRGRAAQADVNRILKRQSCRYRYVQRVDPVLRDAIAFLSLVVLQIPTEPEKATAMDLRDRTLAFLDHLRELAGESPAQQEAHANPS